MRRHVIRAGLCAVLVGLLAWFCAWAALAQEEPKPQPPPRGQNRINRNETMHVLGMIRRTVRDEDMQNLDIENASGMKRTWEAIVAVIPIKADQLKFPKEKAPIYVIVVGRDLGEGIGLLSALPPSIYVVVAQGGGDAAELYDYWRPQEPVKSMTMKDDELEQEQTTAWLMRQEGRKILYQLTLGKHRYTWTLVDPDEEKKPEA